MIENNRTSLRVNHENAYTNNTFDLIETEQTIRHTIENSFHYLKHLQRSYMNIIRFNLTEEDVYTDRDNKLCVSLHKDFIEATKRKLYRDSKYYNKYLDINTLEENPDIFLFLPLVFIDGHFMTNYKIKSALDGHTVIRFEKLGSFQSFTKDYHSIEIVFLNKCGVHQFITNKNVCNKYNWELPQSITGLNLEENTVIFMFTRNTSTIYGSNIFIGKIGPNKELILDRYNSGLYENVMNSREIEFTIISPSYIHEIASTKDIHTKIDNDRQVSLVVINDENGNNYNMPIPSQNIFILKRDKVTGELTYENNRQVIHHYPNIYEIISDDLDMMKYDYKLFYFYNTTNQYLKYENKLKYLYRLIERKIGLDLESALLTLLYNVDPDENHDAIFNIKNFIGIPDDFSTDEIQHADGTVIGSLVELFTKLNSSRFTKFQFQPVSDGVRLVYDDEILVKDDTIDLSKFVVYKDEPIIKKFAGANICEENLELIKTLLKFFKYVDDVYQYNHSDFFTSFKPYDFDYKVEKMKEFIKKDPYALNYYGKKVSTPFISYYLDVRSINLPDRLRVNTFKEAILDNEKFEFNSPYYLFILQNEKAEGLSLRFFIDGILCDSVMQLHHKDVDYIYIPAHFIKEDSFIEIEQFESYKFKKEYMFKSNYDCLTIEFPHNEFIYPTLNDLYITDENNKKVHRHHFRIYALVNNDEYNVSDELLKVNGSRMILNGKSMYVDEETGEVYIEVTGTLIDKEKRLLLDEIELSSGDSLERIPVKYMILNKIKVFCDYNDYLNKKLYFTINKTPHIDMRRVAKNSIPILNFLNGSVTWRDLNSFVRIFVNGRLVHSDFKLYIGHDGETYFIPQFYAKTGDIITMDLTPFSYELEYQLDMVPEDFLISFDGKLSKPFDDYYYDIYLNGRKLSQKNYQVITPDKIKLFNVSSRKNLEIYRRDRDYEYYGFIENKIKPTVPLDYILASSEISEEDKKDIIDDIVKDSHPNEIIEDGTNIEDDYSQLTKLNQEVFELFKFTVAEIIEHGVLRPNTLTIDSRYVQEQYPYIYQTYVTINTETKLPTGRIVIRPNINARENVDVMKVGRNYGYQINSDTENLNEYIANVVNDAAKLFGNLDEITHYADGTIIGEITELFSRLGSTIQFGVNLANDIVTLTYDDEQ